MRLWRTLAAALFVAWGAAADTPPPADWTQTLELLREAVVETIPNVTAEVDPAEQQLRITAEGEDSPVIVNPDNLYRQLVNAASDAARTLILADFVATVENAFLEPDAERSLEQLRPVVRAPLDFGQTPVEARPISVPFLAGLVIYYVWDSENSVSYVTRADLDGYDLTTESLDARARFNLDEMAPEIGYEDYGAIFLVADGFYESTFLLDKPLWDGIEEALGPVLVVVPARDAVIFAPASDLALRADLLSLRDEILEEAPYPLSDRLFLWRDGEWRVVSDVP